MSLTILDGPMGTELARRGVSTSGPAWSAHAFDGATEAIAAIHRDYVAAGATVHTSNTFRTQRRSIGPSWEALARRAVALTRLQTPVGHLVAGSIAPLADCYRPDLSPGEASRTEHAELAWVLADAGVDVLLCETFPDAVEAAVAVHEAARTGVETWVALTAGPDASLMTPEEMHRAALACVDAGARAVLVNCTAAARTLAYVEAIGTTCGRFGAYANAGTVGDAVGWGARQGPATYVQFARTWIEAGATIVGGCCGTEPAHIAALAGLDRQPPARSLV